MAVAFDAYTDGGDTTVGATLTYSHTCTGSDRILLVGVRNGTNTVSSITYGGVAMSLYKATTDRWNVALYGLIAPKTGANDVVITTSGVNYIRSQSASYTGVGSGQPDSSAKHDSASETAMTLTTTTVADNCWLVGWAMNDSGNFVAGANTTVRKAGVTMVICDTNSAQTPAGSKSLSLNIGGGGMADTGVVISISPGVQSVVYEQSASDTFTISDSPSKTWEFFRTLTDTATISDAITRSKGYLRTFTDIFTISDSLPKRIWRGITEYASTWLKGITTGSWTKKTEPSSTWTKKESE